MKQDKKTYCWNCNGRTGFRFGIEPTRHDIHWCSSICWQEFYQAPAGKKRQEEKRV